MRRGWEIYTKFNGMEARISNVFLYSNRRIDDDLCAIHFEKVEGNILRYFIRIDKYLRNLSKYNYRKNNRKGHSSIHS